jgi:hypothetical protein
MFRNWSRVLDVLESCLTFTSPTTAGIAASSRTAGDTDQCTECHAS